MLKISNWRQFPLKTPWSQYQEKKNKIWLYLIETTAGGYCVRSFGLVEQCKLLTANKEVFNFSWRCYRDQIRANYASCHGLDNVNIDVITVYFSNSAFMWISFSISHYDDVIESIHSHDRKNQKCFWKGLRVHDIFACLLWMHGRFFVVWFINLLG